jgi:NAD(P)-dependent dehydrogenase (short-subunit alcohol dehydrogenase family)
VPQQAALAMAQEFDKLDLAFNNAGGHADMKPIDQTTKKEPEWVIGLNFKAVYYGVKYEAECMLKGGGRLVNTASTFGLKAMPEIAHHAASKIAVDGLIRSVALEYASRNIRVNAISPGAIGGDAHAFGTFIPMHRIDHEVAEAVLCLMSDKTSYAADPVLSIDGGIYAG